MNEQQAQELMDKLGISALSLEEQEEVLLRVGQIIFEATLARAVLEMTKEDLEKFSTFVSQEPTPEELVAFLREHVKDFDTIAQEEAEKFRKESLEIMEKITKGKS